MSVNVVSVRKITYSHDVNWGAACSIWWLSMHHKINQKGITRSEDHHLSKNWKGESKTELRSLIALRKKQGIL